MIWSGKMEKFIMIDHDVSRKHNGKTSTFFMTHHDTLWYAPIHLREVVFICFWLRHEIHSIVLAGNIIWEWLCSFKSPSGSDPGPDQSFRSSLGDLKSTGLLYLAQKRAHFTKFSMMHQEWSNQIRCSA